MTCSRTLSAHISDWNDQIKLVNVWPWVNHLRYIRQVVPSQEFLKEVLQKALMYNMSVSVFLNIMCAHIRACNMLAFYTKSVLQFQKKGAYTKTGAYVRCVTHSSPGTFVFTDFNYELNLLSYSCAWEGKRETLTHFSVYTLTKIRHWRWSAFGERLCVWFWLRLSQCNCKLIKYLQVSRVHRLQRNK